MAATRKVGPQWYVTTAQLPVSSWWVPLWLTITCWSLSGTSEAMDRNTILEASQYKPPAGSTDDLYNHMYSPPHQNKAVLRIGYITGSQSEVPPRDIYYRKPGQAISGAITFAVDQINESPDVLPNHILEFLIAETFGQEDVSIRRTATLKTYNISAYIGPQETCMHEGRIAAAFNLPMISYVSAVL